MSQVEDNSNAVLSGKEILTTPITVIAIKFDYAYFKTFNGVLQIILVVSRIVVFTLDSVFLCIYCLIFL